MTADVQHSILLSFLKIGKQAATNANASLQPVLAFPIFLAFSTNSCE